MKRTKSFIQHMYTASFSIVTRNGWVEYLVMILYEIKKPFSIFGNGKFFFRNINNRLFPSHFQTITSRMMITHRHRIVVMALKEPISI